MNLTGTKLVQQVLPEYTTERYYVLSEIEQASRFESEEGTDACGEGEPKDENVVGTASEGIEKHFYYMLWNTESDGIEKFKEDVTSLCGGLRIQGCPSKGSAGAQEVDDETFYKTAKSFCPWKW